MNASSPFPVDSNSNTSKDDIAVRSLWSSGDVAISTVATALEANVGVDVLSNGKSFCVDMGRFKVAAFRITAAFAVAGATMAAMPTSAIAQTVDTPPTQLVVDTTVPVVTLPSDPAKTVVTISPVPTTTTEITKTTPIPVESTVAKPPKKPAAADLPKSSTTKNVKPSDPSFVNVTDGRRTYNSVSDYIANNKTGMKAIDQCFEPGIRPQAVRVSFYESEGYFWAIGKVDKRDHGSFQINSHYHPEAFHGWKGEEWANPFANACEAALIYNSSHSWQQWAKQTRRKANVSFLGDGFLATSEFNRSFVAGEFDGLLKLANNDISNSASLVKLATLSRVDCDALRIAFPLEVSRDPGCDNVK